MIFLVIDHICWKYTIGKKMGEGGFGSVFEGIRCQDGLLVAVKFTAKREDQPYISFVSRLCSLCCLLYNILDECKSQSANISIDNQTGLNPHLRNYFNYHENCLSPWLTIPGMFPLRWRRQSWPIKAPAVPTS